jgi:hypothetical protein
MSILDVLVLLLVKRLDRLGLSHLGPTCLLAEAYLRLRRRRNGVLVVVVNGRIACPTSVMNHSFRKAFFWLLERRRRRMKGQALDVQKTTLVLVTNLLGQGWMDI